MVTAMVFAPLAAASLLLLLPANRRLAIRVVAALASGLSLALAVYLCFAYDQRLGGVQFLTRLRWIPVLGAFYLVGADGISLAMVLLTALVLFAGVFASWRMEERDKEFFVLLLVLVTGVFGVFVSFDLLLFLSFYELAVIPMYLLIAVWGSTRKEYAAYKLTLYLLAGSVLLILGVILVYFSTGMLTFDFLAISGLRFDPALQRRLFPFLFLGFAVLVPMWPFHTWSPDGHAAAPTAVSMLHAGVLMKLGAYGVIRVALTLFPTAARAWSPLIAALCTVNILYGAYVALAQKDLKYVIGYSSVSHMGYVLLGIASFTAAGLTGAVFQMFSHGVMTGLFFALVGHVYAQAHTREIAALGGLAKAMPVAATTFAIAALASLGLPGLSSFVAEVLVFFGAFRRFPALAVLGIAAIVVTASYILRTTQQVFFGPPQERYAGAKDARTVDLVGLFLLLGVLVGFGLLPQPLVGLISTGVQPLVTRMGGMP
ncbi:MAG: NADH-quinone oxidoreductase subunit M [Bacillota bacterium]|nr:NADH-quinone oxidoreductase subunit M [Bacillota bacterium]